MKGEVKKGFFKIGKLMNKFIIDRFLTIKTINPDENKVIMHCRRMHKLLHFTLDEVINDKHILSKFSSYEASQIGYYFGKNKALNEVSVDFFKSQRLKKYSIMMIDRKGDIIYIDRETHEMHIRSPEYLILTHHLIDHFDSLQACYLGILSGIYEKKRLEKAKSLIRNKSI